MTIGGREAADALRADHEKTGKTSAGAAIIAMATTGSPEDVSFLIAQLSRPDTIHVWPEIQAAALTLGFLHIESAREPLKTLLARTRPNTFTRRATATALALLDRPACADSADVSTAQHLVQIVLDCAPEFLSKESRYRDAATKQIWTFKDASWRLRAPIAGDTAVFGTISSSVFVAPGEQDAFVELSMHCGMLCGEGWTYRLRRYGRGWRVISAQFDWVS